MNSPETIDKIVSAYFAALTKAPFFYKGIEYKPKPLLVSTLLFRGYTCPSECGGCCHRVTLDYLPNEPQPDGLIPRTVVFNNKAYMVLSDLQEDHHNIKCRYLQYEDGRCSIHAFHPMPCDVELIKFMHYEEKSLLTQKLYGRGWALHRVDGERGAKCEMLPPTMETVAEVIRKLKRVRDWTNYFDLDTWIDDLIDWAYRYPFVDTLRLKPGEKHGQFFG